MKVNSNRDISFKSVYTNKALKKTFEFASKKPALTAASASVGFSLLRPFSIWLTPNTDIENRKLACAKSITSSLLNFGLMLGISYPIDNAIKKIDNSPEKYLTKETIDFYKQGAKNINSSKRYLFASQLFKLGIMSVVAVPKAIMTASAIPLIIKLLNFKNNNEFHSQAERYDLEKKNLHIAPSPDGEGWDGVINAKPDFRGKPALASKIGKTLDKEGVKNFSEKYKDSNFVMHIIALTDALSTLTFITQTKKSKKIKEERKNALIYNSAISTGMCIGSGYLVDKLLDKPAEKFINKFRELNACEKNLEKQVQGIKIIKPLLILGTLYYMIIPFLSTYLAEITDKKGFFNK